MRQKSGCRKATEVIVSPKRTAPGAVLSLVAATTRILEPIATEARSSEMYEDSTEGWKAEQVRILVTVRESSEKTV